MQKNARLLVLLCRHKTQARQLKDVEYLTKELDALGYDVMVQYAEMKPVEQSAQIDNMVASGCAGIIVHHGMQKHFLRLLIMRLLWKSRFCLMIH